MTDPLKKVEQRGYFRAIRELDKKYNALAEKRYLRFRGALEEIGNLIGAPTMSYDKDYERRELLERVKKVSELCRKALTDRGGI